MESILEEKQISQKSGLEYTDEEKHIFSIITGFFKSKILATAISIDFFSYMAYRPRSIDEIKSQFNIPNRPLRLFLDSLVHMKLISLNNDNKYQNTGLSHRYLVKGKLSNLGDVVEMFDSLYDEFGDFTEMLFNDVPKNKTYSYFFENAKEETEISEYSDQMHRTSGSPAMALSEFYDFSNSKTIIDIGGGTGKACMNLVSQYAHLNCILFDLPAVCEKAQKELGNFWLSHRINVHSGDFFKDELPTGFDTALMMRITHDWSIEQIKILFKKIYNSLPEGGKLMVYETFKSDDRKNPGDSSMVSLLLLTISPNGECRTKAEIKEILLETGFSNIEFLHTIYIYSVIVATK
ncbi:MAG: hypothetical protein HOO91_13570 [Bacteroidales bacterium]|nr:hypothetical protein [Bacteroidales bacterium]